MKLSSNYSNIDKRSIPSSEEVKEKRNETIGDFLDGALEDGTVTEDEINELIKELPEFAQDTLESLNIDTQTIITALDTDKNGEISTEELNTYLEDNGLGSYEEIKDIKFNILGIGGIFTTLIKNYFG